MSGTTENLWAMFEDNDHLELAYKIAKDLGQPKESLDELTAFLQTAPADKLTVFSTIDTVDNIFTIPFGPVVESETFVAIQQVSKFLIFNSLV